MFVMIIVYILPMLGEVSWGGRCAYFFLGYMLDKYLYTFYRDDLIVFLFSGIFKD